MFRRGDAQRNLGSIHEKDIQSLILGRTTYTLLLRAQQKSIEYPRSGDGYILSDRLNVLLQC